VLFEGELTLEGVDDGLDPLAAAGEAAEPGGFVLAVGADQVRALVIGDEGFEVAAGEALVAEDDLPGADQVMIAFQQLGHHFALAQPGARQAPDDRHAPGGGDQVETESQNQREWLAQYPYPASPARSEHFTVPGWRRTAARSSPPAAAGHARTRCCAPIQ
jgi:hypothetical protein